MTVAVLTAVPLLSPPLTDAGSVIMLAVVVSVPAV